MKKVSLLFVLLMSVCLVACGTSGTFTADVDYAALSLDLDDMASYLLSHASFDDDLTRLSDSVIATSYQYPDAESVVVYAGGGATAEKIILVRSASEEQAEATLAILNQYVASQSAWFTDYKPSESTRLENASFVEQYGPYVVYCVAVDRGEVEDAVGAYLIDAMDDAN